MAWNIFYYNLSYSCGDLLGRSIDKLIDSSYSYPRALILIGVPARGLLIASSFLMAYYKSNVFWGNDAAIFINSFLIGITAGFLGTCCGKNMPGRLNNNEKEHGGFMLSVFANSGIAIGGLISLVAFQRLF